jgi:hypothetical protein
MFTIGTMGMWIFEQWLGQVSQAYLSIVPCKKGTLKEKKGKKGHMKTITSFLSISTSNVSILKEFFQFFCN